MTSITEDLLSSVTESLYLPVEISTAYEEHTIISHSTAIQREEDLIHHSYRNDERVDDFEWMPAPLPPRFTYHDDSILGTPSGEPTHISHSPQKRQSVQPSGSDYTIHKLKFEREETLYEETLQIKDHTHQQIKWNSCSWSSEDEDLEELPRFRTRLAPCSEKDRVSAKAIRSGPIEGDDIEILRMTHQYDHGIDMLNELRETVPRVGAKAVGKSLFYETVYPSSEEVIVSRKGQPDKNAETESDPDTFYVNTLLLHYSRRRADATSRIPEDNSDTDQDSLVEQEPIYSLPIKPKTKKINRDYCNEILETCSPGDFIIRRNKENTILSVKAHDKIKHIKLEFDKEVLKVGEESFSSLDEMVEFYRTSLPVSRSPPGPVYLSRQILPPGFPI